MFKRLFLVFNLLLASSVALADEGLRYFSSERDLTCSQFIQDLAAEKLSVIVHSKIERSVFNKELAKVLISNQGLIECRETPGVTPLMSVLDNSKTISHLWIVAEALVEFGANIKAKAHFNETSVLHLAVSAYAERNSFVTNKEDLRLIRELMSRGADAGETSRFGQGALSMSIPAWGVIDYELVFLVLDGMSRSRFANQKQKGLFLMSLARRKNGFENLGVLVNKYTFDVNYRTFSGMTPLMISAKLCLLDNIKTLVKYGARQDFMDDNGMMAADFAEESSSWILGTEEKCNSVRDYLREI